MNEKKALQISIIINFLLSGIAFYYGYLTKSEAILLDGYYSIAGFLLAVISIWVLKIVNKPETKSFNFGYSSIEPLFNLIKGLLILIVIIVSAFNAFTDIVQGGFLPDFSNSILYFLISTISCLLMTVYFYVLQKKLNTSILNLEYKNWLIDTLISASVGFTFVISWMLEGTFMNEYLVYTDAFATLLIILIVIKLPLQTIYSGIREILLSAPPTEITDIIDKTGNEIFSRNNIEEYNWKITKTGREIYILFHAKVKPSTCVYIQDNIKDELLMKIAALFNENIKIDLCFTTKSISKYIK